MKTILFVLLLGVVTASSAESRTFNPIYGDGFIAYLTSRLTVNTYSIEKDKRIFEGGLEGEETNLRVVYLNAIMSCNGPLDDISKAVEEYYGKDWYKKMEGTYRDGMVFVSNIESIMWPIALKWDKDNRGKILNTLISGQYLERPYCKAETYSEYLPIW